MILAFFSFGIEASVITCIQGPEPSRMMASSSLPLGRPHHPDLDASGATSPPEARVRETSMADAASSDGGSISGSGDDGDRSWAAPFGGRGYDSDTGSRDGALEESTLEEDGADMTSTNESGYGDGEEKAERDIFPSTAAATTGATERKKDLLLVGADRSSST